MIKSSGQNVVSEMLAHEAREALLQYIQACSGVASLYDVRRWREYDAADNVGKFVNRPDVKVRPLLVPQGCKQKAFRAWKTVPAGVPDAADNVGKFVRRPGVKVQPASQGTEIRAMDHLKRRWREYGAADNVGKFVSRPDIKVRLAS